jgi:hypothetical protein
MIRDKINSFLRLVMLCTLRDWNIVFVVIAIFVLGTTLHGVGFGLILTSCMSLIYWFLYKA